VTQNLPPNVTVYYTPPTSILSAFAVTSGVASRLSGGSYSISIHSIGEVGTGTQTGGSYMIRSGLAGGLDP